MILRPCLHCRRREGCPIKADKLERARAAGLGLSSAEFRCPERLRGLEPGRRVEVRFRFGTTTMDALYNTTETWAFENPILGTIDGKEDGCSGRLTIWLDAESSKGKIRVRLHPDFPGLTILDETVELCKECGRPPNGYRRTDGIWNCDSCSVPYGADERAAMVGWPGLALTAPSPGA